MLVLIREDAQYFGCVAEVEHARAILDRGTSAHWQVKTYEDALADGASKEEALQAVVTPVVQQDAAGGFAVLILARWTG